VSFSEADNKMNLNYKHLGMYLVAGIVSGLLCHSSGIIDIDLIFSPPIAPLQSFWAS